MDISEISVDIFTKILVIKNYSNIYFFLIEIVKIKQNIHIKTILINIRNDKINYLLKFLNYIYIYVLTNKLFLFLYFNYFC